MDVKLKGNPQRILEPKRQIKAKDPISALTHFIGALFSLFAAIHLINQAIETENVQYIISFTIFGVSLLLLYTASTVYHTLDISEKMNKFLKRIDHMMIFILIAGTYTPVCVLRLEGNLRIGILALVWGLAFIGILTKIFWIHAPRWLYTMQYILMGWTAILVIRPLYAEMSKESFTWLLAGGIVYTVGGIIYGTKWPKFENKWFGFHEVFHLFVMGGSLCHIFMVASLL